MDFILHIFQTILLISLVIVMIWLSDRAIGQKTGYRWRKILWFVLAIRLLFPVKINISEFVDSFHGLEVTVDVSEPFTAIPAEDMEPTEGNVQQFTEMESANAMQNAGHILSGTEDTIRTERKTTKRLSVKHILALDMAVLFWITGALAMVTLHIYQYRRMKKECFDKSAAYEGAELMGQEQRICREIGIKNPVPVRIMNPGDYHKSPMLFGYLKPVLLLPDVSYTTYELEAILKHELLHYRTKDLWYKLLMVAVCDIYWFNPVFGLMKNMAFRDVECVCDEKATQNMDIDAKKKYSNTILRTMSGTKEKCFAFTTQFAGTKKNIKERFNNIFSSHNRKMGIVILCLVLGLLVMGTVGVSFHSSGNKQETATSEQEAKTFDKETNEGQEVINDTYPEAVQLEAISAEISMDIPFGTDGPTLDYAGKLGTGKESIIIFHDYFGLFVYDLSNRKIIRSLDLEPIGCNWTQGDDFCQVAVSADGTTVWLHPMTKSYMYRYEIQENLLYLETLVKTFEIDLEGKELFDRYLSADEETPNSEYVGWRSNYLYEEYEDEKGVHKAYIYLYFHMSDGNTPWLLSLRCVWDDMVCMLFGDIGDARAVQVAQAGEFPYDYEGVTELYNIIYDEPCEYTRVSDTFGDRTNPITQEVITHEGIDYAAEEGTEVSAAADGIVYETGFSEQYGNYVVLLHGNGDMTYYCQCQKIIAGKDAQVKRGEKIAAVGSTGRSTGSHLHFALSRDGEFVNPEEYMRNDTADDEN